MRAFISLGAALFVALAVLTACHSRDGSGKGGTTTVNTTTAQQNTVTVEGDGVRRITPAEAREVFDSGNAVIIDTRGDAAYKSEHIKGSINIPLDQIDAKAGDLPRNKMIITYCSWPAEHTSARAVQQLKAKGIDNAAAILGGTDAWKHAGYPMEGQQANQ